MATVEVRSGINRMTLELQSGETIEDIYERVETALNLDGSDNLNVVVNGGDTRDFSDVRQHGIYDGTTLEFVKRAGSKGC